MSSDEHFLGIDLGTTNSAQAVYEHERVSLVRSADGGVLTPSVVRIDARGRTSVGARARGFLEKDPENTRSEFKRLMGSRHQLEFPAAKLTRTPPELAAEVLKSLRQDFAEQLGYEPSQAVISVPALFELPQIAATSEAARLAGFARVEFVQEPIASALAAGWAADATSGSWLVYDLGGGTFDASLLETREGLLRVVGHEGDNFLGGRDIDQGLADRVLAQLSKAGHRIDVRNPAFAPALRRLRAACEGVKMELTRATEADLQLEALLELDGKAIDVDEVITRAELEAIVVPLVDRSIAVTQRLLQSRGITPTDLERIVLVGGPTLIPALRARLTEVLGVRIATGHDPMTLVAHGAALFALGQALPARTQSSAQVATAAAPNVWLQYPALSSDLHPYVVGKVSAGSGAERVQSVVLAREDGEWSSDPVALDAERAFAISVSLLPRARSRFILTGRSADGQELALHPRELTVVHGVRLGDPPLSRTIGVALASDEVQVFFDRGSPLPIRRTFSLRTVEAVAAGNPGFALQVPIVQGELPFAHLCRLVGSLSIAAEDVQASVPAGSVIEVTLELDAGGRLTTSARIAAIDQSFSDVAQLIVPELTPEAIRSALDDLLKRANALRQSAFRAADPKLVKMLSDVDESCSRIERALELGEGGDPDAIERARRMLVDVDALLCDADLRRSWPELEEESRFRLAVASSWILRHGSDVERELFANTARAVEKALAARNGAEVRRQLHAASRLGSAAYLRDPAAWTWELESASGRVAELSDQRKGQVLIADGRRAAERGDKPALEQAVRGLWELLPADADDRRRGYNSGLR